jgi:hypothetical protein
MPVCTRCGAEYEIQKRHDSWLHYGHHFCGILCLREHIQHQPLSVTTDPFGHLDGMPSEGECYSVRLQRHFRSQYELLVAEVMDRWDMVCCYERFFLYLGDHDVYIPDLVFPGRGVAVEIKGEWRIGAKRKFQEAQRILGGDRLILLGPQYLRLFKAEGQSKSFRKVLK